MPRDPRTYITVHDGMPEHPKVEALSDAAFRLLVECWCYCSRNLTDGHINQRAWQRRGDPNTRLDLIDAGLVEALADGVYMHDYTQHQRTADEVADLRAKRAEAGRKGGLAKASATASAKQMPEQTGSNLSSKLVAESETESEEEQCAPSDAQNSATPDRFDEFWAVYPKKVSKKRAQQRWAAAIKKTDPQVIIDAAAKYGQLVTAEQREPKHIKDPDGWIGGERWNDEQPTNVRPLRRDAQPFDRAAEAAMRGVPENFV